MTKAHMAFQNGAGLINKEVSIDLPKNTQNYHKTPEIYFSKIEKC
jgi:hypothetical protein